MQGPFRGEVGLSQGPHTLAHLQKQFGALSAHSPSPGELQAVEERTRKERMEGWVWSLSAASSVHQSQLAPLQHPRPLGLRTTPSSTLGRGLKDSRYQESPPQMPKPIYLASCMPSSPVLSIRPAHECFLSHLCSLEHREPIEAFVWSVRGPTAPIARPGSSLCCILNKGEVDYSLWPWTISHLTAHRATRPSLQLPLPRRG